MVWWEGSDGKISRTKYFLVVIYDRWKAYTGNAIERNIFDFCKPLPVDINSAENMRLFVENGVIFVPFSECPTKKKGYEKILICVLMIYSLSLMIQCYLTTLGCGDVYFWKWGGENNRNEEEGIKKKWGGKKIKGPFWGAYFWRRLYSEGLIYGGNLRFKIDWASHIVGSKFTVTF